LSILNGSQEKILKQAPQHFAVNLSMHEYGYFYIMTNAHNTVLYCGATTDLYKEFRNIKTEYSKTVLQLSITLTSLFISNHLQLLEMLLNEKSR